MYELIERKLDNFIEEQVTEARLYIKWQKERLDRYRQKKDDVREAMIDVHRRDDRDSSEWQNKHNIFPFELFVIYCLCIVSRKLWLLVEGTFYWKYFWSPFSLPLSLTESTSYEFNKGLLTFQYPEGRWPDSRRDLLALGFMTNQEDAVVLRLDSANSNDFMELEIVSVVKRERCP